MHILREYRTLGILFATKQGGQSYHNLAADIVNYAEFLSDMQMIVGERVPLHLVSEPRRKIMCIMIMITIL